jgi:hypothetical protein
LNPPLTVHPDGDVPDTAPTVKPAEEHRELRLSPLNLEGAEGGAEGGETAVV